MAVGFRDSGVSPPTNGQLPRGNKVVVWHKQNIDWVVTTDTAGTGSDTASEVVRGQACVWARMEQLSQEATSTKDSIMPAATVKPE